MTTCELRLKAAEIIEQRGWCQGGFTGNLGEVCLIGALRVASHGSALSAPDDVIYRLAQRELRREVKTSALYAWNDRKGRTKEEVLQRLRDGCLPPVVQREGE